HLHGLNTQPFRGIGAGGVGGDGLGVLGPAEAEVTGERPQVDRLGQAGVGGKLGELLEADGGWPIMGDPRGLGYNGRVRTSEKLEDLRIAAPAPGQQVSPTYRRRTIAVRAP